MNRKAVFGIVIFLCITLGFSQLLFNPTNQSASARRIKYNPILIDGDAAFSKKAEKNGWSGSGTSSDPYIIENYDLTIPYKRNKKFLPAAAISISNTTVYFEIRFSTISNYNGEIDGIILWNVINGKIYNNTIYNFVEGIFLGNSDYIYIANNDIQCYSDLNPAAPSSQNIRYKIDRVQAFYSHGVFMDPSNHNIVVNNQISGHTGSGVYVLDSSDNLIDGNVIDNSLGENGVFLAGSDYNTITNNEIFGDGASTPISPSSQNIRYKVDGTQAFYSHGVFMDPSNHNIVANNQISGFTGNGVYLLDSTDNIVDTNIIDNSDGENGVFLAGSDYNSITNNDIFGDGASTPIIYSHGVFMDPSNHNIVANNRISDFTGNGVYLLDSSDNLVDANAIDNTDGENGVFLAGSDYNSIINNDIWGSYDESALTSPSSQNIRYRVDGTQAFYSHGVFMDPSNHNIVANNTISNNTGSGLYVYNSSDNVLIDNEVSNNAANGILLENSGNTSVSNNVVYDDDLHGISLNVGSTDNTIDSNDLIGNNLDGTSQIHDDGSGNQFFDNFLVDNDNTDADNDGYSDNPYYIEGDANNLDYTPSSLPVQPLNELDLNLVDLDAIVDYESETLNLKNLGNWMNVKVHLPDGYSVTNVNVSTVYTDGMIYAEEAQVQNARTLIVKFDRPALIAYLESTLPYTPIDVKLNVTGLLNGAFLMFYGYDIVTVINQEIADPIMLVDQQNENPLEIVFGQIIKNAIEKPIQVLTGQIMEKTLISNPLMIQGLTISILFVPMVTTVVNRRFHVKKKN